MALNPPSPTSVIRYTGEEGEKKFTELQEKEKQNIAFKFVIHADNVMMKDRVYTFTDKSGRVYELSAKVVQICWKFLPEEERRDLIEKIQAKSKAVFEREKPEELRLNGKSLSNLPSEIADPDKIVILDLSANRLTELPEVVKKMVNLKELYLDDNELTALPDLPSNVQVLYLNGNRFKTLPTSIWKLKLLSVLKLDRNPELLIKFGNHEIPCPPGITLKSIRYLENLDPALNRKLLDSRYILPPEWDKEITLTPSELPARAPFFQAIDSVSGQKVAIKRIQVSGEHAKTFLGLQHGQFHDDNLITYLEAPLILVERDQFSLCLITECFHQTLSHVIHGSTGNPPFPMDYHFAKEFMIQLANAIGYLHANNYAHCRLTADSFAAIKTAQSFHFKLMDIEWARDWNPAKKRVLPKPNEKPEIPQESTGYLPPEIEYPDEYGAPTLASDVFSLGMIFFEMITAREPYAKIVNDGTGIKKKFTDLTRHHFLDPVTHKMKYTEHTEKGEVNHEQEFMLMLINAIQKKTFAKPFMKIILDMVDFCAAKRKPQKIDDHFFISLNATRPS